MAQGITFALEDVSNDIGYTGFTLDSDTATVATAQTYAAVIDGLSDAALCRVDVKDSLRVSTASATKGVMGVERRGVIELQWDNGTTRKNFTLSIPAVSQTHVVLNKVGPETLTDASIASVVSAFSSLTSYPAAELFVTSSRVYESRR